MLLLALSPQSLLAESGPNGAYVGRFTKSDDASFRMLTEFQGTGYGLQGRYLAGNNDIVLGDDAGVLELIGRSGTRFQFRWTDRWGTGIAYLAFSDDYRSFSGTWTIRNSVEGEWTGQRRSP
jgi:hypothetical protein